MHQGLDLQLVPFNVVRLNLKMERVNLEKTMNIIEMSQTTSQQRASIIKAHVVQVIQKKHAFWGDILDIKKISGILWNLDKWDQRMRMKLSVSNLKLTARQIMDESSNTTEVSIRTLKWVTCKSSLNGCIVRRSHH